MNETQFIDASVITARIAQLREAHSDLDRLIDRLVESRGADEFELRRLKKRKLKVKDTILLLQLQQEPDKSA